MKFSAFSLAVIMLFIASTLETRAEGISHLVKSGIIKRADPVARDLMRGYLNDSDSYNSAECLEYGKKTRQSEESLMFCKTYFKSTYGLTDLSAMFVYQTASELKYSAELRNVLLNYLLNGKKYDVDGCNQAWKDRINSRRKDSGTKKNPIHQVSEEMCEQLFQP